MIFFSYFFGGLSRGLLVSSLPTTIIEMYSRLSTNFSVEGNILAFLSTVILVGSWAACAFGAFVT